MGRPVLGKPTDGPVSKYINRRISGLITRLILSTGREVSPSYASLVSFLTGLLASILVAGGDPLLGGVLIQLSSILDGVDGELARALGRTSRRGGFIDSLLDRVVNISMYLAIGMYLSSHMDPDLVVALVVAGLSGDMMVTYLHSLSQKEAGRHAALIGRVPQIASRDVRLFILFLSLVSEPFYPGSAAIGLGVVAMLSYIYVLLKSVEVARVLD